MMRQENRQAGLKHKEISKMSVEKKIIGWRALSCISHQVEELNKTSGNWAFCRLIVAVRDFLILDERDQASLEIEVVWCCGRLEDLRRLTIQLRQEWAFFYTQDLTGWLGFNWWWLRFKMYVAEMGGAVEIMVGTVVLHLVIYHSQSPIWNPHKWGDTY
jgi:hypothetical protein